jgi:glycosyltransferase involved in cell wall biosynthesis
MDLKAAIQAIRESGEFDADWYRRTYPDVDLSGMDPAEHYAKFGQRLGRPPRGRKNTAFSNSAVQVLNSAPRQDLIASRIAGSDTKLSASPEEMALVQPYFDADYYRTQISYEIVNSDPIAHFLSVGWRLGLSPARWFSTLGYLAAYKDVANSHKNPFVHYLRRGDREGRSPNPFYEDRNFRRVDLPRFGAAEYGPISRILKFRGEQASVEGATSLVVHVHAFYLELLDELCAALARIPVPFRLLVSIREFTDPLPVRTRLQDFLGADVDVDVRAVPNRGRDVAPWVLDFRQQIEECDLFLHIHTKQSRHDSEHKYWFRYLCHNVLGSREVVSQIISAFKEDERLGLIAPGYWHALRRQPNFGKTKSVYEKLLARMGCSRDLTVCPDFPAGSFFWCRTKILAPLFRAGLSIDDFPEEAGQICGTTAHAVERLVGLLPDLSGMRAEFVAVDWPHEQAEQRPVTYAPGQSASAPELRVSVIMPTWNRRNHVGAALTSAFAQSYSPYEVIVVDDGSEDGTVEYLHDAFQEKIKSGLLKIFRTDHAGVSAARNVGLDHAQGDVICYLDSDNTWRKDYLYHVACALQTFPVAEAAYSNFLSHDADLGKSVLYNKPYNRAALVDRNFIDLNVFAHRREALKPTIRFDTSLRRLVDWDFIIRITAKRAPIHIDYIGADYNLNTNTLQNITRTVPLEENMERVRSKHHRERVYWGHAPIRISIKCPAPNAKIAHHWGDWHFANSLSRALERLGARVRIDLLCDWDNPQADSDDAVIVLRGLSRYQPKPHQINLMWHISHPDKVSIEEMAEYDHVFVASHSHTMWLSTKLGTKVSVLLQCADPERFLRDGPEPAKERELLFVGNSRKVDRWLPRVCVENGLPIEVIGSDWEGRLPSSVVSAQHVENEKLADCYRSAKIVLNDHWPDMAKKGFISNRIFDAGLAGSCVLSDAFEGEQIFFDSIVVCSTAEEVVRAVDVYLNDDEKRARMAAELRQLVLMHHTFDHRAFELMNVIRRHLVSRIELSTTVPKVADDQAI